jgi:hypothetical protein
MAVDQTAGLILEPEWSNRYRLALFVQTSRPVAAKSSVISLGPFGDIKVYDEHNFYLSWYPAGLILESADIEPPDPRPVGPVEKQKVISAVQQGLGEILPSAIKIMENARSIVCEGGFVFAQGTGSIGEISSSLHERYRYGLKRYGAYISVDTGKYSTAPEMASHIAREISGG